MGGIRCCPQESPDFEALNRNPSSWGWGLIYLAVSLKIPVAQISDIVIVGAIGPSAFCDYRAGIFKLLNDGSRFHGGVWILVHFFFVSPTCGLEWCVHYSALFSFVPLYIPAGTTHTSRKKKMSMIGWWLVFTLLHVRGQSSNWTLVW